jgi:hypothetical protein
MSASDIRAEVASLGDYFRGDHYHLVLRNCNHFADALVERLTHRRLPAWCNRLAYMGSWVACILPKNLGVSHPDSSDVQSRSSFSSIYARSGAASFQPFAGKGLALRQEMMPVSVSGEEASGRSAAQEGVMPEAETDRRCMHDCLLSLAALSLLSVSRRALARALCLVHARACSLPPHHASMITRGVRLRLRL